MKNNLKAFLSSAQRLNVVDGKIQIDDNSWSEVYWSFLFEDNERYNEFMSQNKNEIIQYAEDNKLTLRQATLILYNME